MNFLQRDKQRERQRQRAEKERVRQRERTSQPGDNFFMGNMPTHCETNSFSSTTGHSIEPITKPSSNSHSFMSSKPSSQHGFSQESLNCSKVGLGILSPVAEDTKTNFEVSDESSKVKNTVLGPQFKINISSPSLHLNEPFSLIDKEKILSTPDQENGDLIESFGGSDDSLPKSPSEDKIGGSSLDLEPSLLPKPTTLPPKPTKPSYKIPEAITASEILLSEDYTRVTCHGPNPKITHVYYGFSLECHPNQLVISYAEKRELVSVLQHVASFPSGSSSDHSSSQEFIMTCDACNKELNEEEDHIYIYRGESSYCSHECLAVGILAEEINKAAYNYSKISSVSSNDNNDSHDDDIDDDDDFVFLMDESTIPTHPNGQ
ncbi:unnamed protein product [Camellia sinensis]